MPQAVAAALGVREEPGRPLTATLTDFLRPRQLLLVLDNCEHLLDGLRAAGRGAAAGCPDLRILATSREALGIARRAAVSRAVAVAAAGCAVRGSRVSGHSTLDRTPAAV